MFATITFLNQNTSNIKGYNIEYNSVQNIEFINITCFKKQAIKRIEKKIYKKVKNVVVDDRLKREKFRKLNVINSFEQTSNTTKDAFLKILNLDKFNFVCVIDKGLKNKDFIKSIINKCELINVVTNNTDEFFEFSADIYAEYGVMLFFNNKNFCEKIGIDLDENYIWFLKSQRKYYARKGSVEFNQSIIKQIPQGINIDEFVFALSQENGLDLSKLYEETVLEKNETFYQINEQSLKKFLDN